MLKRINTRILFVILFVSAFLFAAGFSSVKAGEYTDYFIYDTFSSGGILQDDEYDLVYANWERSTGGTDGYNTSHPASKFTSTDDKKTIFERASGSDPTGSITFYDNFNDGNLTTPNSWSYYTDFHADYGGIPSNLGNNIFTESGGYLKLDTPYGARKEGTALHLITFTENVFTVTFDLDFLFSRSGSFTDVFADVHLVIGTDDTDTFFKAEFYASSADQELFLTHEINGAGSTDYSDLTWDGEFNTTLSLQLTSTNRTLWKKGSNLLANISTPATFRTATFNKISVIGELADTTKYTPDRIWINYIQIIEVDQNALYTFDYYDVYRRAIAPSRQIKFSGYTTKKGASGRNLNQIIGVCNEDTGNISKWQGIALNLNTSTVTLHYQTYINGSLATVETSYVTNNFNWSFSALINQDTTKLEISVGNVTIETANFFQAFEYNYLLFAIIAPEYCWHGAEILFDSAFANWRDVWNEDDIHYDFIDLNASAFSMDAAGTVDDGKMFTRLSREYKAVSGLWQCNYSLAGLYDSIQYRLKVSEWSNQAYETSNGRLLKAGNTQGIKIILTGYSTYAKFTVYIEQSSSPMAGILDVSAKTLNVDVAGSIEVAYRIYITEDKIITDVLFVADNLEETITLTTDRVIKTNYYALLSQFYVESNDAATYAKVNTLGLGIAEDTDDFVIPDLAEPASFNSYVAPIHYGWLDGIVKGFFAVIGWLADLILSPVMDIIDWILEIGVFVITAIIEFVLELLEAGIAAFISLLRSWGMGDVLDIIFGVFDAIISTIAKLAEWVVLLLNANYLNFTMVLLFLYIVFIPALANPGDKGGYMTQVSEHFMKNIMPISIFGNHVHVPLGGPVFIYIFVIILGVV